MGVPISGIKFSSDDDDDGETFDATPAYQLECDTELLYCHPAIANRNALLVVQYRNEGLEHLIGKVMRWSCSAMTIIQPSK